MTKTAKRWAKIVAEWKASGLGAAEFARERKLNKGTLRWWERRLIAVYNQAPVLSSPPVLAPASAGFVRLTPTVSAVAELRPVEVLMASGHTVRVFSPQQADTLRVVLDALGRVS